MFKKIRKKILLYVKFYLLENSIISIKIFIIYQYKLTLKHINKIHNIFLKFSYSILTYTSESFSHVYNRSKETFGKYLLLKYFIYII